MNYWWTIRDAPKSPDKVNGYYGQGFDMTGKIHELEQGEEINPEPLKNQVCPKCDLVLLVRREVCPECGTKLTAPDDAVTKENIK
jgi:hypothetical protein